MQNMPKIVRERLKAAKPVVNHPDPDVLTAFVERSLPERERAAVLEHLARCDDCRDVVALELPAPEAVQPVLAPTRGRWLTWPALRWGFVTAGVVAIAAFGVVQWQRHQPTREMATQTVRLEVPAGQQQTQAAAPPAVAGAAAEKQTKSLPAVPRSERAKSAGKANAESGENKLMAREEAPQTPARKLPAGSGVGASMGARALPHGPRMPAQWQQQNNQNQASTAWIPPTVRQQAAGLAANEKIPISAEAVEVQAPSQPGQTNAEAKDQDLQIHGQASQPQEAAGYPVGGPVGKAKAPVKMEAANASAVQAADVTAPQELPAAAENISVVSQFAPQTPAPLPRWNISPAGGLERSFDQGKTWQEVDVTASLVSSAGLTSEVVAKTSRAKESSADKKALKAAPSGIFRAVTAIGPKVWAGGSNGTLYHSLDAGSHWVRVVPSSGGTILSGDIVALEFSDPEHGKITTSTAELWITSDGGQTWQKQ
jgi:hypothetical protein